MTTGADYWLARGTTPTGSGNVARQGLVRGEGQIVRDDMGIFHPMGVTLFWALYGWKFEREKLLATLRWLAPKRLDYVRILGECDWTGRSWSPQEWSDWTQVLQEFVDVAYGEFGLRSEVTIVGGRQFHETTGERRFIPETLALQTAQALAGREHKVMHYECANEWSRLDKVSMNDLVKMASILVRVAPNLVALSDPAAEREHAAATTYEGGPEEEATAAQLAEEKADPVSGFDTMIDATKAAGATAYTRHPRRSSHDNGWSHVRQGYDFKDFPGVVWNNEPEGPQSSVVPMSNPLQLACCRLLGVLCGGAGYVLHVGQGVTGQADPAHGRPEFMWQVPNIDHIIEVVRGVDVLAPAGMEGWTCVNNGRDAHPLPLPASSFWEGSHGAEGVNKNYAAVNGNQWAVMLTGVRSRAAVGPVYIGTATRACHVQAYDPERAYLGKEVALVGMADLAAGQRWELPGRADTMAAYLIEGTNR